MDQNQKIQSYDAEEDEGLTAELWMRMEILFHSALELPPADRSIFLKKACAGHPLLLERVEALVEADENSSDLFHTPLITFTPIGNQVSHYEIQKKLGAGGMGEVYLARDTRLDRLVALKILPINFLQKEERLRRFVVEAKAASAVSHSNVAHIYEIGEANGVHFIAMEFVEGETLAKTASTKHFDSQEVVHIGIQIARALEAAHFRGIIHRDLKPSNIMMTPSGELKLLDFGIAKIAFQNDPISGERSPDPTQTQAGTMMGTVSYSSPEQLLGKPMDHRTDFFSLGIVLYQIATQRLPFQGNTTIEIADSILHTECSPPDQLNHSISQPLSRVIMKLMAKNPGSRYQEANEIISALEAVKRLQGDRRWLAMHRAPVRTVAFVAALFVIIALFFGWQIIGSWTKKVKEPPAESTQLANVARVSPAAYQAYRTGLNYSDGEISQDNIQLAVTLFQRAVDLNPDFALAWAELSKAYALSYFSYSNPAHLAKSKAAVDRAFQLQPEMAEGHVALGYYYFRGARDYDRALREFRIAQKRLPNDKTILSGQAAIYRRQGKFKESLGVFQELFELKPRDGNVAWDIGVTYTLIRNYPEAQRYFDLCISISPDQEGGYKESALNHIRWKGDTKAARAILVKAPLKKEGILTVMFFVELCDRKFQAAMDLLSGPNVSGPAKHLHEGIVYRLLKKPELAQSSFDTARILSEKKLIERPDRPGLHKNLGLAYAGLGRKEEAIREGKRAIEFLPVSEDSVWGPDGIENLAHIYTMVGEYDAALDQIEYLLSIPSNFSISLLRIDPTWDPLRTLPRYQKLIEHQSH